MFRKSYKKLAALFLACAMAVPAVSITAPVTEAQAADTVTITDIRNKTTVAKKIHQGLMAGKKVVISQYKQAGVNSMSDFFPLVVKLNGYGVKFKYEEKRKSYPKDYKNEFLSGTAYSVYTISEKNARAYRDEVNAMKLNVKHAITSASEDLAQQIHDTIYAKKSFTFYTKGKPTKICDDLKEMIKPINRQGVIFKYTATKVPYHDCYKVTIDKGQAEAYYYAVNIIQSVANSECVGKGIDWYVRESVNIRNEDVSDPEEMWDYEKDYDAVVAMELLEAEKILLNASCMNDVSDIVKLFAISNCNLFRSAMNYDKKARGRYWRGASDQKMLKELYNRTARGTCGDYAKAEEALFSYLGIEVKIGVTDYVEHAWTEGRAANSDGRMVDYKFDYELETRDNNNQGEFTKGENLLTY